VPAVTAFTRPGWFDRRGRVQDSMTFRALQRRSPCELWAAQPAVFEFETLSHNEPPGSRCARNLLDALSQIGPHWALPPSFPSIP
jgi:hypothetical protein